MRISSALGVAGETRESRAGWAPEWGGRRNVPLSPENVLIDTVARLQQDLAVMKAKSQFLRTPGVPTVVPTPRHAAFTSTKVPRFAGTTSWEYVKLLTPLYYPMDGMTQQRGCSYALTWREML